MILNTAADAVKPTSAMLQAARREAQVFDVLARPVTFFNPSLILIGGGVANIGNKLLSSIRQAVLSRSTALATRELAIRYSPMGSEAGVTGAIHLALDHVFVGAER